ncbi:MAG: uracil phosphoribosyltransferase, partial [Selenomonadaceae bacterium]|nr:uracil phosphoribosyltransferase [Selenomonadaceae bacterium]
MPSSLSDRKIYVMDPMLATGGSAIAAIDSIKKHGGI